MKLPMLLTTLALAAGCGAGTSAAEPACRDVPGAKALLGNPAYRFVVFGEAHGAREVPELFGDVVCQASASRKVIAALEWPRAMQPALDAYMASDGSPAARRRLLASDAWSRSDRDGRTSQAMLDLIETLRRLKADGRDVSLQAFAISSGMALRRQDYGEIEMARNLGEIANGDPSAPLVLVLAGNVHAGKQRRAALGGVLGAVGHLPPDEVMSLNAADNGGARWGCSIEKPLQPGVPPSPRDISCGARSWPTSPQGVTPRGITLGPTEGGMYDGVFSTGAPTTASAPAWDAEDRAKG
jgi:hypothetical protein